MTYLKTVVCICLICLLNGWGKLKAQTNVLYSAGHAGAFIGGLYDVQFSYTQLTSHGDFGLGAPAELDGELMLYKHALYKTQYTGKTTRLKAGTTPYAIACYFKADKVTRTKSKLNKNDLYRYIDSLTSNKNGLYAIHLTGKFSYIKTRAFPPVKKPYKPLAQLLPTQRFFEFNDIKGDLIGFKLPDYMEGPFIKGYHFHFLSDNKTAGGHIIDVTAEDVTIEIDELTSYQLDLPQTESFRRFKFADSLNEDIKNVENGKKD